MRNLFIGFICLYFTANAETGQTITETAKPEAPVQSAKQPMIELSPAPEGFVWYKTVKSDSLQKICSNDAIFQNLFLKVNRLDENNFPKGKIVLVPIDKEKAVAYVPIPSTLAGERQDREIMVFLDLQYFGAYEKGALAFWGPVSTGAKGRSTPAGTHTISYKCKFMRSKTYNNAPMPFAQNLSGTGYFFHQQTLPGFPASHGCIRLLMSDAEKLYNWSQIGDQVTILNSTQ